MTIELDDDGLELAHILLGLRFLQISACWLPGEAQEAADLLIDSEGHNLMDDGSIDELCERINTSEGDQTA